MIGHEDCLEIADERENSTFNGSNTPKTLPKGSPVPTSNLVTESINTSFSLDVV